MKKVYAVLVKASRIVIVDADSESEAQKLAMDNVEFYSDHHDEAETMETGLTAEDVKSHFRHGAQDLLEHAE